MKKLLAFLLCLFPSLVLAQGNPILQSGNLTPRHLLMGIANGVAGDAGPALGGPLGTNPTELGITNTGTPLCITDAAITNPYHQLCFGANALGGGTITYGAFGGAIPLPLQICANGTCVQFPFTPMAVLGPNRSTVGDIAVFNNTTGTLIADSGIKASGLGFSPIINPMFPPYNCKGDGVTDDTACMQIAINAASNGTLYLDGTHKFLITSGLISIQPITIQGTNGNLNVYTPTCPNGLITNSNTTLLTLLGTTATVKNVCFQMATTAGTRTSGAAIVAGSMVGVTPAQGQGKAIISENTIINPYDGILIGGNTTGSSSPAQTNGNIVHNNVIISPSNRGIANGASSTGDSTVGTDYKNNQIACFAANTNSIGIALYDGAVTLDQTTNGPYHCNVGTYIYPGLNQEVTGMFTGVFGDTVISHGLLIDSNGGAVVFFQANNWWAATNTDTVASGSAITIQNTSGTPGHVGGLIFSNGIAADADNIGQPPISLVQLRDDVYNISFIGNQFISSGTATGDTAFLVNSNGVGGTVRVAFQGNQFVSYASCFAKGVYITGTGDDVTVTNNNFGEGICNVGGDFGINENVIWTSTDTALRYIINNNMTASIIPQSVVSASAIIAPGIATTIAISGTTPINTMAGYWMNRQVMIFPGSSGLVFNTGGGTGAFCNSVTSVAQVPIIAIWSLVNPSVPSTSCWRLK